MTVNIMVDLETMSTRSNAAICSIGAVKFEGTEILDTFYCTVDLCKPKKYDIIRVVYVHLWT